MEPDAFAAMQSRGESGESFSFCTGWHRWLFTTYNAHASYEASLIFKITTRRTAEPAPPGMLTYASGDGSVPE